MSAGLRAPRDAAWHTVRNQQRVVPLHFPQRKESHLGTKGREREGTSTSSLLSSWHLLRWVPASPPWRGACSQHWGVRAALSRPLSGVQTAPWTSRAPASAWGAPGPGCVLALSLSIPPLLGICPAPRLPSRLPLLGFCLCGFSDLMGQDPRAQSGVHVGVHMRCAMGGVSLWVQSVCLRVCCVCTGHVDIYLVCIQAVYNICVVYVHITYVCSQDCMCACAMLCGQLVCSQCHVSVCAVRFVCAHTVLCVNVCLMQYCVYVCYSVCVCACMCCECECIHALSMCAQCVYVCKMSVCVHACAVCALTQYVCAVYVCAYVCA
nr:uncharacterized protein LOC111775555 [Equus caballus]XP_023507442.1 uncharacterized protein LOC111775555 [Equus caballus]XP_023507443.1 uncharacterized protein LOC111775555 [Equus caballus]XP_023507444.1 uncharacterized protein LOC111775555 [Equus caballus]